MWPVRRVRAEQGVRSAEMYVTAGDKKDEREDGLSKRRYEFGED